MVFPIKWSIKLVKVKDLRDYKKNPRKITKDHMFHLQGLIEKFGLIDKPIVNQDMCVIGGHQRIRVLKKMKIDEVECWFPNRQLKDKELEQLCVGLNLNQGSWDYDILANEFEALDLLAYGFSEEQLLGTKSIIEKEQEKEKKAESKKKQCPACGTEF